MHTSQAGKQAWRREQHTPYIAPRVCPPPCMPALPGWLTLQGRQTCKSRHASTESLWCPASDRNICPNRCISLICMDCFSPACLLGKEKAPSAPPPLPCPSTRAHPVSSHACMQAGRQAHRQAWHLAACKIPSGPTTSAREHQPRATSFKDAVATLASRPRGCQPHWEERGRKVWQLGAGCTSVQLLVGLLWFPCCPQQQQGLGVFPMQMMLPT